MKLNWFKLVQFCLDLDQLPQKCIFFSEKCPKRVFLAFLKLLGDVVGEECLSPAEACLPLPFPIVLLSLHLIIYRGMLAAIPLSFLLWNVEAYPFNVRFQN